MIVPAWQRTALLTAALCIGLAHAYTFLTGESLPCTLDGDIVDALPQTLSFKKDVLCISCFCQNGVIKCGFRCPKIEGCYRLIDVPDDPCSCKSCQGCPRPDSNTTLVHGGLARDGCSVEQCESGVITVTEQQCHVPCAAPLPPPPGQCCPACPGCRMEGHALRSGDSAPLSSDPCVSCQCLHNSLVCAKQACPVLSCPAADVRKMPGHCCPVCIGSRRRFNRPPQGHCFLNHYLQYNGSTRSVDPCTSCTCTNSDLVCTRRTCPALTCPAQYQVAPSPGGCCASCRLPEVSPVCLNQGKTHQHGDTWRLGACASCHCTHGQVTCQVDPCPTRDTPCPLGHKLVDDDSSCCPRCEPQPSTCLAYGAPHYRTYDGLNYDFQGDCKYTLTKDCGPRAKFRVKIINHSHSPNSVLPFTRSLVVKLHLDNYKIKVTMMVSRKTKVNGSRVRLPYKHREDVLVIDSVGHGVQLNTTMGLRLLWDGESYIEVELDPKWHNKTCGLCGNFNGNPEDDLVKTGSKSLKASHDSSSAGRDDSSDLDATTALLSLKRYASLDDASLIESARTWAQGRCSRKDRQQRRQRPRVREERLAFCSSPSEASLQRCQPFQSSVLQSCHAVLPPEHFQKSCIEDMCRCSGGRQCQCASLLAYSRECQRLGVDIPEWRNATNCGGLECPHGAEYMECAPACRPTCRNPSPNPDCHTRRCLPGCYCPFPTVLHRGSCIPSSMCFPNELNKHRRKHRMLHESRTAPSRPRSSSSVPRLTGPSILQPQQTESGGGGRP